MARGWWRTHFEDHPLYVSKQSVALRPPEVYANTSHDKIRLYCRPCLQQNIGSVLSREELEASTNPSFITRDYDTIKLSLFNVPPNVQHAWIEARTETLLIHLRDCQLQDSDVQARAAYCITQGNNNANIPTRPQPDIHATPRAPRTLFAYSMPILSPQPIRPSSQVPIAYADPHHAYSQSFNPGVSSGYAPPQVRPPSVFFTNYDLGPNRMDTNSPAPSISSQSSFSDFSRAGSPANYGQYPDPGSKVRRTSSKRPFSRLASASHLADSQEAWTNERQSLFEEKLGRMTASAGLPLSWVNNPEFLEFCQNFIPGACVPSRKTLSKRIIPNSLKEIRSRIKIAASGGLGTVQCDGWTGENHHHFVAFMVSTKQKMYTVRVNDTTTERKTAENLLSQMIEVIDLLQNDWGINIIAFTTDASGESRKARRLLREKWPKLVTPDCYAHQINLIVGDYFKSNVGFLAHSTSANELISWLRSKTVLLGLIREACLKNGKPALSVIRPVATRWTAFYLAYRRLILLRETLEYIVIADANKPEPNRQVIPAGGDATAKNKARKMVNLIKNPLFWNGLIRIKHHLAPLAIAANITQSAHCRLDDVLLTFGALAMEFQNMAARDPLLSDETNNENETICKAVLESIERRWLKSDQDVFLAAVILNPFVKLAPFQRNPRLISLGSIHALLSKLWRRFFESPPPHTLYEEIQHYIESSDIYESLKSNCDSMKATAAEAKSSPNAYEAFRGLTIDDEPSTPLIRLALHVLSICPNSASCERLFSQFGLILTKLRTRLAKESLVNLAEYKLHIRDDHLRKDTKKHLRARGFGVRAELLATGTQSSGDISSANITPLSTHSDALDGSDNSGTTSNQSLSNIASQFIGMLDRDKDTATPAPSSNIITRRIQDIFKFDSMHWVSSHRMSAVGSLDEEMEFYDLLDLDASGDFEVDLDDCVASILNAD